MRQILLQNAKKVYYKMCRVFYYKMRQYYYKMQQLLQIATFITKCVGTKSFTVSMEVQYVRKFLVIYQYVLNVFSYHFTRALHLGTLNLLNEHCTKKGNCGFGHIY